MVKGLRRSIDEIIDYKNLPYPVETVLFLLKVILSMMEF